MGYIKFVVFEEKGFVVFDSYNQEFDFKEWFDFEYNDWKLFGDICFVFFVSVFGEIECNGFWNYKLLCIDKDGVWIDLQVVKVLNLMCCVQEFGVNVGCCCVIELQLIFYGDCFYNFYQDDNNCLNFDGMGWVVCGFFNLIDDKDSYFVLWENCIDLSIEYCIVFLVGVQLIVDIQCLWYVVMYNGMELCYCFIMLWILGFEFDVYIEKYYGIDDVFNYEVDQEMLEFGYVEQVCKDVVCVVYYVVKGQQVKQVMSEV